MVTVNPFDPKYQVEGVPWDVLAEARGSSPVCPMPQGGYLLTRQEEVLSALKEIEVFRADLTPGLDVPSDELFLSEIPEPRHGSVRRLYNAHLGPHRIAQLQPFVREVCHELLDHLLDDGQGDLVHGYTDPVPARVVAGLIGVPAEDADTFVEWAPRFTTGRRIGPHGTREARFPSTATFRSCFVAGGRWRILPPMW